MQFSLKILMVKKKILILTSGQLHHIGLCDFMNPQNTHKYEYIKTRSSYFQVIIWHDVFWIEPFWYI